MAEIFKYDIVDFNEEIIKKLIDEGKAKYFGNGEIFLSTEEMIKDEEEYPVDGRFLEDWIQGWDGGEYYSVSGGIDICMSDVMEYLDFDKPINSKGETYKDIIYNADNPNEETEKIIKENLILKVESLIEDLRCDIEDIKKTEYGVLWN